MPYVASTARPHHALFLFPTLQQPCRQHVFSLTGPAGPSILIGYSLFMQTWCPHLKIENAGKALKGERHCTRGLAHTPFSFRTRKRGQETPCAFHSATANVPCSP